MEIKWSSEQLSIYNWFTIGSGNALLRARAGSAKTTTLVEGLNRSNVSSMLYVVFNKRNQLEAEKKITNKNVTVKTLHSLGFSYVLKNWRGVKASSYTEFSRVKTLYPDAPKQIDFEKERSLMLRIAKWSRRVTGRLVFQSATPKLCTQRLPGVSISTAAPGML